MSDWDTEGGGHQLLYGYDGSDEQKIKTSGSGEILSKPFDAVNEIGLTELVGKDEQVDQNEYGASVGVDLSGTQSGEILSWKFVAKEDGGAVQDSAGALYVFDADPGVTVGTASMGTAAWEAVVGRVDVIVGDWETDNVAGAAYVYDTPVPFHAAGSLWFAWYHKDATSLNDGAGDDETLSVQAWYRRDS